VVAVGCGGDDEKSKTTSKSGGGTPASGKESVDLTQGGNLKFAMVTHSDEGSFWSVVKKGAQQAAKDEGVKLIWSQSTSRGRSPRPRRPASRSSR
jgi:simple sugar transport system substrate-binding protein